MLGHAAEVCDERVAHLEREAQRVRGGEPAHEIRQLALENTLGLWSLVDMLRPEQHEVLGGA